MAEEQHFQMWSNVPGNSRLVVSATGTTDKSFIVAVLDGLFAGLQGPATPIMAILETVSGTEHMVQLEAARVYGVDINVQFMTNATATIHAHIEDPDGVRLPGELNSTVTRSRSKSESFVLSIGTSPGEGA
jgi:hypothetical protein